MPQYPFKLRTLVPVALALLFLHAIAIRAFPAHTMAVSYPFTILAPALALFATVGRARFSSRETRLPGILLSAGLLLWTCGILLSAWEELFQHISATVAFYSDFAFFLYGVPVLLAISYPREDQRAPLFLWLDALQAILTAYLTYITLFAVIPFTTRSIQPMTESLLVTVYNVENLLLAAAATLRVLARPHRGEERRFYLILCAFLWTYAFFVGIYNYISSIVVEHSLIDVISNIPFLFLAVASLLPRPPAEAAPPLSARRPIAIFIDNASPIFYTLVLLILGIAVSRQYFAIGIAAVVFAIGVYGLRTTILQGRYMQSQQELQRARDRLEEMSLEDSLTKVANRRCFDQMLEFEWNRATRTRRPLALLLIDVDYFKNLNDRYGHRFGDHSLIEIAAILKSSLARSGDLLARYGGEEFAVILPETDSSGSHAVAARMQEAVRSLNIQNETSLGNFATVSIGIAVYEFPQLGVASDLVEASDRALYKAKQNGRNRIEVSSIQSIFDTGLAP